MRRSLRLIAGAGALAAATIVPLGATAGAATVEAAGEASSATAAAGWQRRGPFSTYAACDRVRSQMVSLGYATQPCFYLRCETAPCTSGWYYRIYA